MFHKIYAIVAGILVAAAITAAAFAHMATGGDYAGHGLGAVMLGFASLLLPQGWKEDNTFMITVGSSATAGNLALIVYFVTLA